MPENDNLRSLPSRNPVKRMMLNPEKFDPDKLTVNEIDQGNGVIFAKIPNISGRISRRKKKDGNCYIELIIEKHYDPKTQQNRNKKVIIGEDISYYLRGMMIINDNYHEYFNIKGEVMPHILQAWVEEEKEKRRQEEQKATAPEPKATTTELKTIPIEPTIPLPTPQPPTPEPELNQETTIPEEPEEIEGEALAVRLEELRQKEQALKEKERELKKRQKDLESQEMIHLIQKDEAIQDHIKLLRDVLHRHIYIVEEQAKRRPDNPMSIRQIRTINELLQELRDLFRGSEAEDLLHLAEEPKEDEPASGTTYGEMALLLNAYECMLTAFAVGRLRNK